VTIVSALTSPIATYSVYKLHCHRYVSNIRLIIIIIIIIIIISIFV